MMQSFTMMALVTVLWALFGYSLVFHEGWGFLGNLGFGFLHGVGAAPNPDYYDGRIRNLAKQLTDEFRTENSTTRLGDYWDNSPVGQKPMMSLRDIDEAGRFVPARPFGRHRIRGGDEKTLIAEALRIVRRQRSRVGELDSDDGEA